MEATCLRKAVPFQLNRVRARRAALAAASYPRYHSGLQPTSPPSTEANQRDSATLNRIAMYVTRIQLKNVRCFEELCLEFGQHGSSMLILADNGQGKSTLLRSLAMGLCDESSAAALFRELPGEFVRRPKGMQHVPTGNHGEICIDFVHENDDVPGQFDYFRIRTKIVSGDVFERINQDDHLRDEPGSAGLFRLETNSIDATERPVSNEDFKWADFFVSGYGAGSRTSGTADYRYYLPVDAVYPIFNYSNPLQNPELAIRRLIDAAHKVATAKAKDGEVSNPNDLHKAYETAILEKVKLPLKRVLDLDDIGQIEIQSNAILVRGTWGIAELAELGDGYRSTVTWILDLFSWWFLYFFAPESPGQEFDASVKAKWEEFLSDEVSGIVIIDEIDQHLHPKWQHSILPNITRAFPLVQFIATTHSPMTVIGTTEIDESRLTLIRLEDNGNGSQPVRLGRPTRMRADQVLTDSYFGLNTASDNEVKALISEFSRLEATADEKMTPARRERRQFLRTELSSILGTGETFLERKIAPILNRVIEEFVAEYKAPEQEDAATFEALRQLEELTGD